MRDPTETNHDETAAEENAQDEAGPIISALTNMLACNDLPDPAPADPMPLLLAWFEDARKSERYEDFNAMTLATATPGGLPSARIVLCKAIELQTPALVFYTSYTSRKGEELESNPHAAAVFHWPHARRQARIEGRVRQTSPQESDAYFKTRPLLSRIGAAASRQSAAIASRRDLIAEAVRTARRTMAGRELERPDNWGGYRIVPDRVELWSARTGRLHDRVLWSRSPESTWSARRLSA
ncbi:MAG: pyridoxamine 5'-phosphate oxidase [Phycisphaerales bacterium]|nr:pyridoxamine 5'-phosphate oxidase [Phycisphaerales bacterium]